MVDELISRSPNIDQAVGAMKKMKSDNAND